MDPDVARRTWRTLEPYHGAIYFVPEGPEEYEAIGLVGSRVGYFASRAAAMGAVGAEVVIATFFNFDPALVRASMRGVWATVTPSEVTAARLRAADRMLRRTLGDAIRSPEMTEAADLARRAATVACADLDGRPLFAGHVSLDWPDDDHLVLWHAQTLLREYRGDGHIAALVAAGVDGCEALVTHAAAGDVPGEVLRATRARTDDDWSAAIDRLCRRGWLGDDGSFTERGRAARLEIERVTDERSVAPYEVLGDDGCARLRELVRPWSRVLTAELGRPR